MLTSTDRILTTHAGSLPRPSDLRDMVFAKAACDRRWQTWFAVRPSAASTA